MGQFENHMHIEDEMVCADFSEREIYDVEQLYSVAAVFFGTISKAIQEEDGMILSFFMKASITGNEFPIVKRNGDTVASVKIKCIGAKLIYEMHVYLNTLYFREFNSLPKTPWSLDAGATNNTCITLGNTITL